MVRIVTLQNEWLNLVEYGIKFIKGKVSDDRSVKITIDGLVNSLCYMENLGKNIFSVQPSMEAFFTSSK